MILLYVKEEEKKHRPFKYLFLPERTQRDGGKKKLTYFGSVLFYSSFLMLIPHSLF